VKEIEAEQAGFPLEELAAGLSFDDADTPAGAPSPLPQD